MPLFFIYALFLRFHADIIFFLLSMPAFLVFFAAAAAAVFTPRFFHFYAAIFLRFYAAAIRFRY